MQTADTVVSLQLQNLTFISHDWGYTPLNVLSVSNIMFQDTLSEKNILCVCLDASFLCFLSHAHGILRSNSRW